MRPYFSYCTDDLTRHWSHGALIYSRIPFKIACDRGSANRWLRVSTPCPPYAAAVVLGLHFSQVTRSRSSNENRMTGARIKLPGHRAEQAQRAGRLSSDRREIPIGIMTLNAGSAEFR